MTQSAAHAVRPLAAGCIVAGFALGSLSPCATLRAAEIGVWGYAEPLIAIFLASAVLVVLGVALASPRIAQIGHPAVWFVLALALWSVVTAPFVTFPWLDLLGYHQSGQGPLWYLAFAGLIGAALVLTIDRRAFAACLYFAVAAGTALAVLMALDAFASAGLLPEVRSLLAYLAPPLLVIGWCRPPGAPRWQAWRWGATLVALLLLALSENRTAMGAVFVGCLVYLAGPVLLRRRALVLMTIAGAALGPLVLTAWIAPWLGEASLLSRHYLVEIAWHVLQANPAAWVTGFGWGATPHLIAANLQAASITFTGATQWDLFTRDYFHLHNWALETLVSTGLPGLAAAAGLAIAPFLGASDRHRAAGLAYTITLLLIDGLWFQAAYWLPFHALAIACLHDPVPARRAAIWPLQRLDARGARWPAAAIAAALLAGLLPQVWFTFDKEPARDATFTGNDPDGRLATSISLNDPRQDELAFYIVIRNAIGNLDRHWGQDSAETRFSGLAAALANVVPRSKSPLPALACMGLYEQQAKLSDGPSRMRDSFEGQTALWAACVDALLRTAPERTDRLIYRLTRLAVEGRVQDVRALAGRILRRDPDDPVGLYFSGLAMTFAPGQASKIEGLLLVGRAIDEGLGRFMPIDATLRAAVRDARRLAE